jgi:hypothetical protein
MQDYHQLDIWNRAMDYAVAVYEFIPSLPEQEKYNLASQLRRAVTSAPLNIAEGCGAASKGASPWLDGRATMPGRQAKDLFRRILPESQWEQFGATETLVIKHCEPPIRDRLNQEGLTAERDHSIECSAEFLQCALNGSGFGDITGATRMLQMLYLWAAIRRH